MKRKFEIIDESERYYRECPLDVDRSDIQEAFVQGAQWADKTMIEKACQWLRECLSDNITYVPETFYGQPKPVISEEGLEDFIKYLKE